MDSPSYLISSITESITIFCALDFNLINMLFFQIIDIQRMEIKKLRTQVGDLELTVQRPGSGARLPPMQAV